MSKLFENKHILHIVSEIVILVAIIYNISSKFKTIKSYIDDICQRLDEQDETIEKQNKQIDFLIAQLKTLTTQQLHRQPTSQPPYQPTSRSTYQPTSQSTSQPTSQSTSQPTSQTRRSHKKQREENFKGGGKLCAPQSTTLQPNTSRPIPPQANTLQDPIQSLQESKVDTINLGENFDRQPNIFSTVTFIPMIQKSPPRQQASIEEIDTEDENLDDELKEELEELSNLKKDLKESFENKDE